MSKSIPFWSRKKPSSHYITVAGSPGHSMHLLVTVVWACQPCILPRYVQLDVDRKAGPGMQLGCCNIGLVSRLDIIQVH